MKFRPCNSCVLRGLLALSVSLAVVISGSSVTLASFWSAEKSTRQEPPAALSSGGGMQSSTQTAIARLTESGVRLEWSSAFDSDNLGFNVYRLQGGKYLRINGEIIPGAAFVAGPGGGPQVPPGIRTATYSYATFDPKGTRDSIYYIESVSQQGDTRVQFALSPASQNLSLPEMIPAAEILRADANENAADFETSYPSRSTAGGSSQITASAIEDQWTIAGQTGLKIGIKKDGWYRVTQPQMAAAGFNPAVDLRNLQLFADGKEVAIITSQSGGLLSSSAYIEFFGRAVDTPTTDVHTYYLVAAGSPGKRIGGELQIDSTPLPSPLPSPSPQVSPPAGPAPKATWSNWVVRKAVIAVTAPTGVPMIPLIFWPQLIEPEKTDKPLPAEPDRAAVAATNAPSGSARTAAATVTAASEGPMKSEPISKPATAKAAAPPVSQPPAFTTSSSKVTIPAAVPQPEKQLKPTGKKRRKTRSRSRKSQPSQMRREFSHALGAAAIAPTSFASVVYRKDRNVYFSSLLNGDEENFFGQVISSSPATQTVNTPNPASSVTGTAKLEVRIQGVNFVSHNVSVKFNEVQIGTFSFFGHDNPVQTFDIPVASLADGANTIKFTPGPSDTSIVDYTRITYPHAFRADSDALKFSLPGTQSLQVDGFSNSNVKLIDYTDPFNVRVIKPVIGSSGGGYAITVPAAEPKTKAQRLFYAVATAAETPASIILNQPSTLNAASNAADFLIVTTSSLAPSLAPLITARQNQGMSVVVANVEDVFDEFGYGLHGPQALKDFLARARLAWTTKPRYVIFAGDATYDPRNYMGVGNFDLVPTKLVDATYNETASDDWLADFDDDGIADMPIGRLPVRTAAEMDLVVSKIVNFSPANVPQTALLVADDPGTPPVWDFESGNDDVQGLIQNSVGIQRINLRTESSNSQATTNIISSINSGRAVVNYSGHGNVNVWSGASIFTSSNASALTNGDKLTFVVVMDCLNGYYHDPNLISLSEAFLSAPNGGAVAAFASSGLTTTYGQRQMELELYRQLYGAQPIALGDAIKIAKEASYDFDVRRTWVFFGDPSIKIR